MKKLFVFVLLLLSLLCAAGGWWWYSHSRNENGRKAAAEAPLSSVQSHDVASPDVEVDELTKDVLTLASELRAEIDAEKHLNMSMTAQLRAYHDLLELIQTYSQSIEKEMEAIAEISKNEFQEDVTLQASLFTGKKPKLVADHLEEFSPNRVGAILAKMKENEASEVMDVWAKEKTAEASLFYRQVVDAFLLNKRRDMQPELFDNVANAQKGATIR